MTARHGLPPARAVRYIKVSAVGPFHIAACAPGGGYAALCRWPGGRRERDVWRGPGPRVARDLCARCRGAYARSEALTPRLDVAAFNSAP